MANEAQDSEESARPGRPGRPIEIARLLGVVAKGRNWLLVSALVGLGVGVAVAKWGMTTTYEANAAIMYRGLEPLEPGIQPDTRRELPALAGSLFQDAFLQRVRDARFAPSVPLAVVQARFTPTVDAEGGVIALAGQGNSPEDAAGFVNTLVNEFLAFQVGQRSAALEQEAALLEQRIVDATATVEREQSELNAIRQQFGLTAVGGSDLTDERRAAMAAASELRADAISALADLRAHEAQIEALRGQLPTATTPTPPPEGASSMSSAEVAALRTALNEAQAELVRERQRLSEDHPRMQSLMRRVRDLQQQLQGAGTGGGGPSRSQMTALREAERELAGLRSRHESLTRQADEAEARLRDGQGHIEAANAQAELTVATDALTELRTRRARIQTLLTNVDSGFRVVAAATPPEGPAEGARGRKYKVAFGIPIALVGLTIAILLVRAFRSLKLVTARELAYWANGPVVGATAWPRDPRALTDLVAELDDYVPDSRGTMLVVGLTEKEAQLAVELARHLGGDWSNDGSYDLGMAMRPGEELTGSMSSGRKSLTAGGGDFENQPTNVLARSSSDLLAPPTLVQSGAPYGLFTAAANPAQRLVTTAWEGGFDTPGLRRQARLADRVLVVAPSGAATPKELRDLIGRLGRSDGVGYVLVGVTKDFAKYPDRCGPVNEFWAAMRSTTAAGEF